MINRPFTERVLAHTHPVSVVVDPDGVLLADDIATELGDRTIARQVMADFGQTYSMGF